MSTTSIAISPQITVYCDRGKVYIQEQATSENRTLAREVQISIISTKYVTGVAVHEDHVVLWTNTGDVVIWSGLFHSFAFVSFTLKFIVVGAAVCKTHIVLWSRRGDFSTYTFEKTADNKYTYTHKSTTQTDQCPIGRVKWASANDSNIMVCNYKDEIYMNYDGQSYHRVNVNVSMNDDTNMIGGGSLGELEAMIWTTNGKLYKIPTEMLITEYEKKNETRPELVEEIGIPDAICGVCLCKNCVMVWSRSGQVFLLHPGDAEHETQFKRICDEDADESRNNMYFIQAAAAIYSTKEGDWIDFVIWNDRNEAFSLCLENPVKSAVVHGMLPIMRMYIQMENGFLLSIPPDTSRSTLFGSEENQESGEESSGEESGGESGETNSESEDRKGGIKRLSQKHIDEVRTKNKKFYIDFGPEFVNLSALVTLERSNVDYLEQWVDNARVFTQKRNFKIPHTKSTDMKSKMGKVIALLNEELESEFEDVYDTYEDVWGVGVGVSDEPKKPKAPASTLFNFFAKKNRTKNNYSRNDQILAGWNKLRQKDQEYYESLYNEAKKKYNEANEKYEDMKRKKGKYEEIFEKGFIMLLRKGMKMLIGLINVIAEKAKAMIQLKGEAKLEEQAWQTERLGILENILNGILNNMASELIGGSLINLNRLVFEYKDSCLSEKNLNQTKLKQEEFIQKLEENFMLLLQKNKEYIKYKKNFMSDLLLKS